MASNPAAKPEAVTDVQGDGRWMSLHNRFLAEAKEKEPEVLFVGDSLIQQLQFTPCMFKLEEKCDKNNFKTDIIMYMYGEVRQIWRQMFEPLHCLNFGIGGDQTQHVLWRLANGELEYIDPKVVVLLVGTNNHEHTAEQVADGILAIVSLVRNQLPRTQIIVMGIPPRGEGPNKLREKIVTINSRLAESLSGLDNCTFLPVDPGQFMSPEGLISCRDMYDYLHLTPAGYQKLCEPLLDEIQNLMKTYVKVDSTSVETASMAGQLAGDMS